MIVALLIYGVCQTHLYIWSVSTVQSLKIFFLCWVVKVELELKLIGIYAICNLKFLDSYIFLSLIYVYFFSFQISRDTSPLQFSFTYWGGGATRFFVCLVLGESWEEEEREKYLSGREYLNSIEFLLAMRIWFFIIRKNEMKVFKLLFYTFLRLLLLFGWHIISILSYFLFILLTNKGLIRSNEWRA